MHSIIFYCHREDFRSSPICFNSVIVYNHRNLIVDEHIRRSSRAVTETRTATADGHSTSTNFDETITDDRRS